MLDFSKADYSQNIHELFNENFNNLPIPLGKILNETGVYAFTNARTPKDKITEVLYIGKAKNLRNRLQNYKKYPNFYTRLLPILSYLSGQIFNIDEVKSNGIPFGCMVFCFRCDNIDYIEKQLIRHYKPRFNIRYNNEYKEHGFNYSPFVLADKDAMNDIFLKAFQDIL